MPHALGEYGLLIHDDEYHDTGKTYKGIAADVGAYWNAFISICQTIKGDAMEGHHADYIDMMASQLGEAPGKDYLKVVNASAAMLDKYIEEIDAADKDLYG